MDAPLRSGHLDVGDGRIVGFAVWGDADSTAPTVVHCHGTPGGRLVPYTTPAMSGRRHISLDRPGFGLSDPQPSRTVGDHAADVERVLDHLGIGRFSAFGWSGGGPHALGLGALLPDRVARVAILGCPAPDDDPTRWTLRDLDAGPGYAAALAVEGTLARVLAWQWAPGVTAR